MSSPHTHTLIHTRGHTHTHTRAAFLRTLGLGCLDCASIEMCDFLNTCASTSASNIVSERAWMDAFAWTRGGPARYCGIAHPGGAPAGCVCACVCRVYVHVCVECVVVMCVVCMSWRAKSRTVSQRKIPPMGATPPTDLDRDQRFVSVLPRVFGQLLVQDGSL